MTEGFSFSVFEASKNAMQEILDGEGNDGDLEAAVPSVQNSTSKDVFASAASQKQVCANPK